MAPTPRYSLRARASLAFLVLSAAPAAAQAPAQPAVIGRWNMVVTAPDGTRYPSWLEISKSGHATLVGRIVHRVGSSRPISNIEHENGVIRFAIPRQWEEQTGELRVEGTLTGSQLAGQLTTPGGERHTWAATRAPWLERERMPTWGTPIALFDGKSLDGWTTEGPNQNKWSVVNGILTNAGGGANLMTTRKFDDFKLQVEFRYPKGSNSGIYLRGRYEAQIEDIPLDSMPNPHQIGGIYGFLPPNQNAAKAPGEWNTYEITLVGRRVTVVLNGKTVVADAIIPGMTGGAIDSDEGSPGPILLQGDHGPIEFRRVVLTPAR